MKVILLAPTPPPAGGIAGWTKRMMEARLKNGWQVEVVDEKVIGGREVFGDGSRMKLSTEIVRCLRIWRDLWCALSDREARVVHSCIPSRTLSMLRETVCALITKVRRRKFIIHFRCTVPNTTQGRIGKWLLKRLCNLSDLAMVLNAQSAECVGKITRTPVVTIPNFIEESAIRTERPIRDVLKRIVYVGGVIADKGCHEMIEAAKSFPEIEFRLVGHADAETEAAAKGVSNVVLPGATDRKGVEAELEQADVFMFLSRYSEEGFSNALAEAMAVGLPCIVTDWAANADMIENRGGVVVPVNSVPDVVKAVEAVLPKNVRTAQSQFNMKKVREQYSARVVLDLYVDAYEELVK